MKNTFLSKVIEQIPKGNDQFASTCILLPTKRACQYFRDQLLKEMGDKTVWLPTILSIQDFLYQHVPLTIAPDDDLLAQLHTIHAAVTHQDQGFGAFYRWGQMILKDFNEIDQYLIDPDYLFHYVREFKEIETDPLLSEEQLQLLNQFWTSLPEDAASEVRQNFLQTWESLGEIYAGFNKALEDGGFAYEGQAYRALLMLLESHSIRFEWQHFHIAGFNALSTLEERLFSHLASDYDTKLYWDVDPAWLANKSEEPGHFIRKYSSLFPDKANVFIEHDSERSTREVEVTELPLDTLQVDYALDLVARWGEEDTVMVLCDESLVYPLTFRLNNESSEQINANITMGFPVAMSSLVGFLKDVVDLQAYWQSSGRISPTLMLKVIGHPETIRCLPAGPLAEMERRIVQWGFINKKDIDELFGPEHPFFNYLLFQADADNVSKIEVQLTALIGILEVLPEDPGGPQAGKVIKEQVIEQMEEIVIWASTHEIKIEPGELWAIIKYRIAGLKIPFEREDTSGLQVMGFLETRNLDFRNIVILSADDRNLPGNTKHASFIPYSIKRGLDMPTHREHDAIYSYHFFRLLLRADNVALLHSTQSAGMNQSRSRFIEQILYGWKKDSCVNLQERTIHVPVPASDMAGQVSIKKNEPSVRITLDAFGSGEKQFSASSLTTYIHCPFQFYLKYIAGLKEPEEFSEDYDQRDLGRVFHRAMEVFYQPFLDSGELINREILGRYLKQTNLDGIIQRAYELEKYILRPGGLDSFKGQNLLINKVIEELMRKVISRDMAGQPFRIAGLEMRCENVELSLDDGRKVLLKGFLDRVDEVHSEKEEKFVRIVDYKTGKAEMLSQGKKLPEDYFQGYFANSKYKEGFQGYLYAWLYRKANPRIPVKVAFYTAREINRGLKYLSGGKVIEPNHLDIFEDYLRELVCEILDEDTGFTQTDKKDAYRYSAFSVLVD